MMMGTRGGIEETAEDFPICLFFGWVKHLVGECRNLGYSKDSYATAIK